jgi:methionyl-tRNA formyltransferase
MLRVVFMGSDAIALPALNWLAAEGKHLAQVVAVYTQPDRAVGRGQQVQVNAIKQWALDRSLPVRQPEKISTANAADLATLQPDLTLVMAYGHILRPDIIGVPRLGTLNLHTSILPAYRGASPIQTAITQGETTTGVTLMRIVPQLDAGPVADMERVVIAPLDTAAEVEGKLALACVPLLARSLPRLAAGTQAFTEQPAAAATFCRRLDKSDGVLDFSVPAAVLAARINGLMPWPGCTVTLNGQPVKLGLAEASTLPDYNPVGAGVVIGTGAGSLLVETGQGILRLRKLQRPGGKMLPAEDFLRGFPVAPGTRLASQPMPPLVAGTPFQRPKV